RPIPSSSRRSPAGWWRFRWWRLSCRPGAPRGWNRWSHCGRSEALVDPGGGPGLPAEPEAEPRDPAVRTEVELDLPRRPAEGELALRVGNQLEGERVVLEVTTELPVVPGDGVVGGRFSHDAVFTHVSLQRRGGQVHHRTGIRLRGTGRRLPRKLPQPEVAISDGIPVVPEGP